MGQIFEGLNENQKEAVLHTEGPLLILAAAGSGKTRVITYRIAHLLESGIQPQEMLAVTFTNKAAQEMKHRIEQLAGVRGKYIWISTFHALCAKILRNEYAETGMNAQFSICDEGDQRTILRQAIAQLGLDEKKYSPMVLKSVISRAKDELEGAKAFRIRAEARGDEFFENVAQVYEFYEKQLEESGNLDFGDLLFKTVQLFQSHPEILQKYQERFRYFMVDEYQDTNQAQYLLVKLFVQVHNNICVVGDDDQSIYSWRGANIRNILNFEKDYPDTKVVRLEQNYRSTKKILSTAWQVVKNNSSRKEKTIWTENNEGEDIRYWKVTDERDEAWSIANEIDRLIGEGYNLRDMAVFYRTNAQSRGLEEIFRKAHLPYLIIGSVKFYDRKEIKDVLSYLRVMVNPRDSISLKRIINVPARGIGNTTIEFLESLREEGMSLYDVIEGVKDGKYNDVASGRVVKSMCGFYDLMKNLSDFARENQASDVVRFVLETTDYFERMEDDITKESRVENVKELVSAIKNYEEETGDVSLEGFLQQAALMTDLDTTNKDAEYVTLMTLHLAKGLEFPVVFMTGMEEGLFPHSRSDFEKHHLEEERRLCYVGMTRAREKLYLLSAGQRKQYGQTKWNFPSRFIKEAGLIEENKDNFTVEDENNNDQITAILSQAPKATFNINDRVRHKAFGIGRVVALYGEGEAETSVVQFQSGSIKKLLLKYAGLEKT